jgi:hypothetical protein
MKVGSVKLSLLSGTLLFRDVRFYTENMAIRILEGYIVFRYWRRHVRTIDSDNEKHPTRIEVHLNGFEWFIYNRTDVYERLRQSFESSQGRGNDVKSSPACSPFSSDAEADPNKVSKAPTMDINFMRWLPTSVRCGKGSITVGNDRLGHLIVAKFSSAQGWESLKKVDSDATGACIYERSHVYTFQKLVVSFYEHIEPFETKLEVAKSDGLKPSRSTVSSFSESTAKDRPNTYVVAEPIPTSSTGRFTGTSKYLSRLSHPPARSRDFLKKSFEIGGISRPVSSFPSADSVGNPWGTRISSQRGRRKETEANEGDIEKGDYDELELEFISEARWKKTRSIEYAKATDFIDAPSAIIDYRYELYLDRVKSKSDSKITSLKDLRFSVDIHFDQGTIHYGPWTERQRYVSKDSKEGY